MYCIGFDLGLILTEWRYFMIGSRLLIAEQSNHGS